jgi:hypothetical protein
VTEKAVAGSFHPHGHPVRGDLADHGSGQSVLMAKLFLTMFAQTSRQKFSSAFFKMA